MKTRLQFWSDEHEWYYEITCHECGKDILEYPFMAMDNPDDETQFDIGPVIHFCPEHYEQGVAFQIANTNMLWIVTADTKEEE